MCQVLQGTQLGTLVMAQSGVFNLEAISALILQTQIGNCLHLQWDGQMMRLYVS